MVVEFIFHERGNTGGTSYRVQDNGDIEFLSAYRQEWKPSRFGNIQSVERLKHYYIEYNAFILAFNEAKIKHPVDIY